MRYIYTLFVLLSLLMAGIITVDPPNRVHRDANPYRTGDRR